MSETLTPESLQMKLLEAIAQFPVKFQIDGHDGTVEIAASASSTATIKSGKVSLVVVEEGGDKNLGTYNVKELENKMSETKPKKKPKKKENRKAERVTHYDFMRRLILEGTSPEKIFKLCKDRFKTHRRGSHKNDLSDANTRTRISLIKKVTRDKWADVEAVLAKQEAKKKKEKGEKVSKKTVKTSKKVKKGKKSKKK